MNARAWRVAILAAAVVCAAPRTGLAQDTKGVTVVADPRTAQSSETFVGARRYALVVGINAYQNGRQGISNLRFAVNDANAMYDALVDSARCGFRADDVVLLTDRTETKPTGAAIGRALSRFVVQANEDDLVLIFFSGHGYDEDGRAYLLPTNADLSALDYTAIERDAFIRQIDKLRARKVIVILDACHSGGVSRGGKAAGKDVALDSTYYVKFAGARGRAFIASCAGGELSWEDDASGHGVFTASLIRGLSGAADVGPLDGIVSLNELRGYLERDVVEWAARQGRAQHPQVNLEAAYGDMPLAVHRLPAGDDGTDLASDVGPGGGHPGTRGQAGAQVLTARGGTWFAEGSAVVWMMDGPLLRPSSSVVPRVRFGASIGWCDLVLGHATVRGKLRRGEPFSAHLLTLGPRVRLGAGDRFELRLEGAAGAYIGPLVSRRPPHVALEYGAGIRVRLVSGLSLDFGAGGVSSNARLIMPAAPQLRRALYASAGLGWRRPK